MKIGIYNPYLDSLSGGERYALALASHWSKSNEVHLFWDDVDITAKANNRFSIDLHEVRVVPNVFAGSIVRKLKTTARYDLIFVLSDGSIPWTLANKNIIHFQVPFRSVQYSSLKMKRYQAIVYNSKFTSEHIDKRVKGFSRVIYPPVDVDRLRPSKKRERIILSVGRFSSYHTAKKQDVLIDAFRKGCDSHVFDGYTLILAGGLLASDTAFFSELKKKSHGYPIELVADCPLGKLKKLYETASVYWHAAGSGETNPELAEHFGITTVEAMAGGCIPVVYNGGGQPEIIGPSDNTGFLWNTVDELIQKTETLLSSGAHEDLRRSAVRRAKDFSTDRFEDSFDELLLSL